MAVGPIIATYPATIRPRTSVEVYDALVLEVILPFALVTDSITVLNIAFLVVRTAVVLDSWICAIMTEDFVGTGMTRTEVTVETQIRFRRT